MQFSGRLPACYQIELERSSTVAVTGQLSSQKSQTGKDLMFVKFLLSNLPVSGRIGTQWQGPYKVQML